MSIRTDKIPIKLMKELEEDYAIPFGNIIEIGYIIGYSGTIPWHRVVRETVTPEQMCQYLNEAYRSGQRNAIANLRPVLRELKEFEKRVKPRQS